MAITEKQRVAIKFCELCDWLLQVWQLRKFLFDENPDFDVLKSSDHAHFFYRLHIIIQEYWLHQLAKMHDPAIQNSNKNLTINYMIQYGELDDDKVSELKILGEKMNVLSKKLKDARNKALSHNDLSVLLNEQILGEFSPGEDEKYFGYLIEFADIISQQIIGGPFAYYNMDHYDLVSNDVECFMSCFNRGLTSHP